MLLGEITSVDDGLEKALDTCDDDAPKWQDLDERADDTSGTQCIEHSPQHRGLATALQSAVAQPLCMGLDILHALLGYGEGSSMRLELLLLLRFLFTSINVGIDLCGSLEELVHIGNSHSSILGKDTCKCSIGEAAQRFLLCSFQGSILTTHNIREVANDVLETVIELQKWPDSHHRAGHDAQE